MAETAIDPAVLEGARAQDGTTLAELNRRGPVLLVFLRHFG